MKQELLTALNEAQKTGAEIFRLSKARGEDWQTDYAKLRVKLQDELERAEQLAATADDNGTTSELVSDAVTKLTNHQARWPVLIIEREDEGYRASGDAIQDAFDALFSHVRKL